MCECGCGGGGRACKGDILSGFFAVRLEIVALSVGVSRPVACVSSDLSLALAYPLSVSERAAQFFFSVVGKAGKLRVGPHDQCARVAPKRKNEKKKKKKKRDK